MLTLKENRCDHLKNIATHKLKPKGSGQKPRVNTGSFCHKNCWVFLKQAAMEMLWGIPIVAPHAKTYGL